jgi:hypothetical protein
MNEAQTAVRILLEESEFDPEEIEALAHSGRDDLIANLGFVKMDTGREPDISLWAKTYDQRIPIIVEVIHVRGGGYSLLACADVPGLPGFHVGVAESNDIPDESALHTSLNKLEKKIKSGFFDRDKKLKAALRCVHSYQAVDLEFLDQ